MRRPVAFLLGELGSGVDGDVFQGAGLAEEDEAFLAVGGGEGVGGGHVDVAGEEGAFAGAADAGPAVGGVVDAELFGDFQQGAVIGGGDGFLGAGEGDGELVGVVGGGGFEAREGFSVDVLGGDVELGVDLLCGADHFCGAAEVDGGGGEVGDGLGEEGGIDAARCGRSRWSRGG